MFGGGILRLKTSPPFELVACVSACFRSSELKRFGACFGGEKKIGLGVGAWLSAWLGIGFGGWGVGLVVGDWVWWLWFGLGGSGVGFGAGLGVGLEIWGVGLEMRVFGVFGGFGGDILGFLCVCGPVLEKKKFFDFFIFL